MPMPGGEGDRRDGIHAGDQPCHRRASWPVGRHHRHLLRKAGPAEQSRAPLSCFACLRAPDFSLDRPYDCGFLWFDGWCCRRKWTMR